jgi:hypothetical protein
MMPAKKMANPNRTWEQIAHEAQTLRDETLAEVGVNIAIPVQLSRNITDIPDKVLSRDTVRITSLSPQEIVFLISNGKISAQKVIQAFLERAAVAQNLVSHLSLICGPKPLRIKCQPIEVDKLPHRAFT